MPPFLSIAFETFINIHLQWILIILYNHQLIIFIYFFN